MLEIILVSLLVRRIGALLREKGRKPLLFQFLTVVLWFGGELTGAVIGAIAEMGAGAYLLALLGAAAGAAVAYAIARSAAPVVTPQVEAVFS
jgi:hypothetical protein